MRSYAVVIRYVRDRDQSTDEEDFAATNDDDVSMITISDDEDDTSEFYRDQSTDEEDFAATNDDDEFSRKRRQIADIIDIIYISDDES